jgi:hypothetical protein
MALQKTQGKTERWRSDLSTDEKREDERSALPSEDHTRERYQSKHNTSS